MLTNIGKPAAPADAVDRLLECHQRIRAFLALAARLGEAGAEPADAVADAAGRLIRYFTLALPLHARDEEDSIAPRLEGREPAVDAELAAMAREHREHEPPLALLVAACDQMIRDPGRRASLAAVVRRATWELGRHFGAHLAREEQVIFPAVRRLLDAGGDAAVVQEIRLRRRGLAEPAFAGAPVPALR